MASLNESDTRSKLIDPALYAAGWGEGLISREETAGAVVQIGGQTRRQNQRVDYLLRLPSPPGQEPVAVALIEAKAEHLPPGYGLEQARRYARQFNVPFVFSSNGHRFVEYDYSTGRTSRPRQMSNFPGPDELRRRYETAKGFSLDSDAAQPLLQPYPSGANQRRYYQDAAIRSALEQIAGGGRRALLSMATGSGKTFIAVQLLKKIADAGQLRRALFLCDRDELRTQALAAFQGVFGSDAAAAKSGRPQLNARIVIATYQTLGLEKDDADSSFLRRHYAENYFSHIIIDEAHRSAWGKWSEVLERNAAAVQIGLTATPREFEYTKETRAAAADRQLTADNLRYFGEPAYEYAIWQGIEDGYLALMEIRQNDIYLNARTKIEEETGVDWDDLEDSSLSDHLTGELVGIGDARAHYAASSFERRLMMPDRVNEMCASLFQSLLDTGGPEQKTIIFCASDAHADAVAAEMGNRYADYCAAHNKPLAADYAFKCTAAAGRENGLAELKGSGAHHFIAATVDLLTTGVDVPAVRNIAFFKYVRSPIAFYQMVGRGTRIDAATGKLMFRVYDYTNATRLFSADFKEKFRPAPPEPDDPREPRTPQRIIEVRGIEVHIADAGIHILQGGVDGQPELITMDEYKDRLAAKLLADIPTLDEFRETWIDPPRRRELLARLPDEGRAPEVVQNLTEMRDYDIYDVLVDLAYRQAPQTRAARAEAFAHNHREWLDGLGRAAAVIDVIAVQFANRGTDNLENHNLMRAPAIQNAGGLNALRQHGPPNELMTEIKRRMFSE